MKQKLWILPLALIMILATVSSAIATNTTVNSAALYPSPLYETNPASLVLSVTNSANLTLTAYTQFDINSVNEGTVKTRVINTNKYDSLVTVATLGSGPYHSYDTVGATYWVSDGVTNTTQVRTTRVVNPANNKALSMVLCPAIFEFNPFPEYTPTDTTGVCRNDTPYFNLGAATGIPIKQDNICSGVADDIGDWMANNPQFTCSDNEKYSLTLQNLSFTSDSCLTNWENTVFAIMDCTNLKGIVKAHNNETHLLVDDITNDEYGRGINYTSEQAISYDELDFHNQIFVDVNGTPINVSFAVDFFTFGDNEISLDSATVPTVEAEATLMWEDISGEPNLIYKDGEVCSEADCSDREYDSATGEYTFVVTEFSTFSLGYSPDYDADDLSPIIIDGLGKFGVFMISMIALIALVVLFVWGRQRIKR